MIIDLINSSASKNTVITGFSVGEFVFDCTLEESHESRLTVTENAMESGALVADHSYLEPKTYSVRGLMVSYKPFIPPKGGILDQVSFAKKLPLVGGIAAKTEQVIAKLQRYAGKILNAVDTIKDAANRLAPWLPDSLSSLGDKTEDTLTRQAQAYEDLLTIQRNGKFLNITSGLKSYNNVLLVGVVAVDGTEDSVEFALQFKEVFIVETRTVSGLVVNVPTASKQNATKSKVDGDKKTGRAATQSAKPKAKGKTQPVKQSPSSKKSVARSIGDMIRG